MPATESTPFMSVSLGRAVSTNVDADSPVTQDNGRDDDAHEEWQNLIDYRLIEWVRDPDCFDDEGIDPPSRETVRVAIDFARVFRDEGLERPTRLVPDAHGGIVFEFQEQSVLESYRISDNGSVEYCRFLGPRLVEREVMTP